MAQITLGNFSTTNGKTTVSGSQSGLDTEALIKGLTEARRLPAVNLESLNKKLDKQKTALSSLQSILTRFKTAVDTLRNPPGVGNASKNIFEYRTAGVTASNGSTASNYATVKVQPGAAIQTFTIDEVTALAFETKQESGVFTLPATTGINTSVVTANGSPTAGLFQAGTFALRVTDGGADAQITLNENESLQSVANKFNAVKDRTGIQATILKVSDGVPDNQYKLIFTATKTGLNAAFDLGDAGTVTADSTGVLSQLNFNTTQPASNARLTIDGVAVERQGNNIDDLVTGITFTLKQATPVSVKLNVGIQPDTEIVANAITQLADVYNEFRIFNAKQTQLGDDGLPTEDAVLSGNSTLRAIGSTIGNVVTGLIAGITGGNPNQLAGVGIDLQDFAGDEENPLTRNIMVVDTEKLNSSLLANFDGVRSLFEYQLKSDNPLLTTFSRTNGLNVSSFSIAIDRTAVPPTYQATYTDPSTNAPTTVDLNATVQSTGGLLLKGPDGSALAGLQLLFASNATTANINVNVTQGFGDRLFNTLNEVLDTTNGSLTKALTNLDDQVSRNEKEITTIDEKVTAYRDQLVNKFSTLEAALSKANSLMSLLDAQANARDNA